MVDIVRCLTKEALPDQQPTQNLFESISQEDPGDGFVDCLVDLVDLEKGLLLLAEHGAH